jgi:tetratricopeptide (TPR) repeat protein
MLDCEFFGLNPSMHHLVNLLYHTANTLLLLWLLHIATGRFFAAVFISAAFALHPMHVESVAWIAERKDVLSTFFWLLTMIAHVRYTRKPNLKRYILVILLFVLGLLSKPMVVTLPFILLLLDYWPLNRMNARAFIEKFPLIFLSAISCCVTFIVQRMGGAVIELEKLPLDIRLGNAIVNYVSYISKIFFPSDLAVLYPTERFALFSVRVIISLLILLIITAFVMFMARRKYSFRPLVFGWFWFIGTLVPVIGLIQVGKQSIADRYTYIPATGIFIMVSFFARLLVSKLRSQNLILMIVSFVLVLAMALGTYSQLGFWKDSVTLFSHALDVTENNYVIHYNIACMFMEQRDSELAEQHYKKSLQIKPDFSDSFGGLGVILLEKGQSEKAIEYFNRTIQIQGEKVEPYVYNNLGRALQAQGKLDSALANYNKALQINHDNPKAHFNLAILLFSQKKYDLALDHLFQSMQLAPEIPYTYFHIGKTYMAKKKLEKAVQFLSKAIELKPDWFAPVNILARVLVAYPESKVHDPQKAIRYAIRACELTDYKNASTLDTLSVCYASAGRFSEALNTAQKAMEIARISNQKRLIDSLNDRINIYKSKEP